MRAAHAHAAQRLLSPADAAGGTRRAAKVARGAIDTISSSDATPITISRAGRCLARRYFHYVRATPTRDAGARRFLRSVYAASASVLPLPFIHFR
jgi:hypothetical protein